MTGLAPTPTGSGAPTFRPVIEFLLSLAQALSARTLYGGDHPSLTGSRARAYEKLQTALTAWPSLRLTLLDNDLVVGRQVVFEMRQWELGERLSRAGVQRIEFTNDTLDDAVFGELLAVLHRALMPSAPPLQQAVILDGVRLGPVALLNAEEQDGSRTSTGTPGTAPTDESPLLESLIAEGLAEELDTMQWISDEAGLTGRVPMGEVEAVIRSLSMAMQAEQATLLPLVSLKSVDQYTTVHACNVSMLSMGLAEALGFSSRDVRSVGTAALLHDIGKVRLPVELLTKPVALTDDERVIVRRHPVEGARLLGERGAGNALSAIVAYEHHVWANGQGGYPSYKFARVPHYVSRLVQVCDVYDALSTDRPYRQGWPRARTLQHMRLQAGRELDYDLLLTFFDMLDRAEKRQARAS
jgi:putative nucleotidyltransferase with HDIG domain